MAQEAAQYLWLNGKIVERKKASVDILSYSLHYGYGFFEGVRAYETAHGTAIFRLQDHTDRFFHSGHLLNIPILFEKESLNFAHIELLQKNELTSAYLRPLCYLNAGLGLHAKNLHSNVMIAASPWDAYMGEEKRIKGLSLKTSTIRKQNVNSVFTKSKATGNYLHASLALQEAQACGCDEALMLDSEGFVTEGSAQNFFMVKDKTLITPDISSALPGITRDTIMVFARELNIPLIERRITRDEVYEADEVFITGTAAEVTPIHSLDFRYIKEGKPGPITQLLQDRYFKTVRGELSQYQHWLTFIPSQKEAYLYSAQQQKPEEEIKLIILDRDGVINEDSDEYIKSPEEWKPIKGSLEAIAKLNKHGYTVAVVTNQAGVGRGLFDETTLNAIHEKMQQSLLEHGGEIDKIIYCPHHPDDHCDCRKPNIGMFLKLKTHYHHTFSDVMYIGDSYKDIEVARTLGITPVLVLTGNGLKTLTQIKGQTDVLVYPSLEKAVDAIVDHKCRELHDN